MNSRIERRKRKRRGEGGRRIIYIKTTSSNISANQDAFFSIAKFEKGVGTLFLFLLAVQAEDGKIDIVEQLGVVFNARAAAKEDNNLLGCIAFEEGEEKEEALVGLADHVALL